MRTTTLTLTAAARPKGWRRGALARPHTHTPPGLLGGGRVEKETKEKGKKEGARVERAQLAKAKSLPQAPRTLPIVTRKQEVS